MPDPSWPDGVIQGFKVDVRAKDKTGNTETPHAVQFTVDSAPPESGVASPAGGNFVSALSEISGTCTDGFSGISNADKKVYIQIVDITSGTWRYFNGGGWDAGVESWLQVTSLSTPTWSYAKSEVTFNWKNGHRYIVLPRAEDMAQNIQTVFSTSTFYYDRNAVDTDGKIGEPNSAVGTPSSNLYTKTLTAISGTAQDQPQGVWYGNTLSSAGIKDVYIKLKDDTAAKLWTGSTWTATGQFWLAVSGKESWSYPFNNSDWINNHKYIVNTKARDNTDVPGPNVEISISTRTFYIDQSSPTAVTVSAPSGNLKTRPAAVSGTAKDDTGAFESGIIMVKSFIYDLDALRYWNVEQSSWQVSVYWATTTLTGAPVTGWNASVQQSAWTDGHQYRMKCEAWDLAGNGKLSDYTYFTFDETAPESFVSVPTHGAYYPEGSPASLSGTASDNKSGVTEVLVRLMKKTGASAGAHWRISDKTWRPASEDIVWSTTTLSGSNPWSWSIPSGNLPAAWENGLSYLVVAKSKDAANNEESVFNVTVDSNTFTYDTSKPLSGITNPAGDTNSPPQLMGTCFDASPGNVSTVTVRIKRSGNQFYHEDGATPGWQDGSEYWNKAVLSSASTAWWWLGSIWNTEVEYTINSRAKDNAGNWEASFTTFTFINDYERPVSNSTAPFNASYKTLNYIGGIANDDPDIGPVASGLSDVKLMVMDITENTTYYWQNPTLFWSIDVMWKNATGLSEWGFDEINDIGWKKRGTGHRFRIMTKAKDWSGNEEIPSAGFEFVYDTSTPVSVSTGPVNNTSYSFMSGQAILAGTAKDEPNLSLPRAGNAGLDVVNISLKDKSNSNCWTGSSWTATSPYWI
ncbi:MAG: hypothetical protein FP827_06420, partial [Candidatus Omnitrophica bacterium]|nr:hypothetical protein [Candidatus Omnitrophota bacterium]